MDKQQHFLSFVLIVRIQITDCFDRQGDYGFLWSASPADLPRPTHSKTKIGFRWRAPRL